MNLRSLSIELINNLSERIKQISSLSENEGSLIKERLVFLVEDLDVLITSINTFDEGHEVSEINYILQLILEKLEHEDFYSLKALLKFELEPLLEYWKGIFNNEED